jgi:hypothetical protein
MSIRRNIIALNHSNNNNITSNSDDEQSSSINNNTNDCNLLLNGKSRNHPDTSIFDESSILATVSDFFFRSLSLLIERHFCLSYSISGFSLFHLVVLLLLAAEEKIFFSLSIFFFSLFAIIIYRV